MIVVVKGQKPITAYQRQEKKIQGPVTKAMHSVLDRQNLFLEKPITVAISSAIIAIAIWLEKYTCPWSSQKKWSAQLQTKNQTVAYAFRV